MKRVCALFVIVLLVLGLAACTDGKTESNDTPPPEQTDNIPANPSESGNTEREEITKMFVTINENKLEVTLAENSSAEALVEILKQGDITYTANDYGDFEKVGDIGQTLPQNNEQITTQAGDVILYQGHNICLYYAANSWNFTRIGKIIGYSASELRSLLGAGNGSVQVTLSLR